jgi:hypothetical protein
LTTPPFQRPSTDLDAGATLPPPHLPRGGGQLPARLPETPLSTAGTVLTTADPVARLSRLQSGIGAVVLALRTPGLPVSLGALWQTQDGRSGQLVPTPGTTATAPAQDRPVLLLSGTDRLVIDCRQVRRLRRLCVYGTVTPLVPVTWTGNLTISTTGAATAVIPLEAAPGAGVMPLCTVVLLDGRLYVRAERRLPLPCVRDLAHEFGFTRLTWADPDNVM